MLTDLDDLIRAIEDPNTSETEREDLLSKINIYGYKEEQAKGAAVAYWKDYLEQEMRDILVNERSIESHVLNEDELKEIFSLVFEEYQARKKDLGIDDIRKFWTPI